MRRYLIAGLLLWVPLGVTFLVVKVLVDVMDRTLLLLPPAYRPENLFGVHIPGTGAILALLVVLLTGMLLANILGRRLLHHSESLVARIPFVRTVYSGAKSFAETVFSETGAAFKKVLLIEYPRRGIWSLAFLTSSELGEVQAKTGKEVVCVFVPTTPNPTSGFVVMVPRDETVELDMEVEKALKMIISLGVVVPHWDPHGQPAAEVARLAPGETRT